MKQILKCPRCGAGFYDAECFAAHCRGCAPPDEFELMDQLATILGVAGPESQEARNNDVLYQRRVLRKAIAEIKLNGGR